MKECRLGQLLNAPHEWGRSDDGRVWEYHVICDSSWEGWVRLSIDVNMVWGNMAVSPFEDVKVVSVGSVVYCEFRDEWLDQAQDVTIME